MDSREAVPAVSGEFGGGVVTPVGKRVLVVDPGSKEGRRTRSGLFLPDTSEDPDNSPTGVVVAVGPDVKQVRVGDTVFLNPDSVRSPIGRSKEVGYLLFEEQLLGVWKAAGPKAE